MLPHFVCAYRIFAYLNDLCTPFKPVMHVVKQDPHVAPRVNKFVKAHPLGNGRQNARGKSVKDKLRMLKPGGCPTPSPIERTSRERHCMRACVSQQATWTTRAILISNNVAVCLQWAIAERGGSRSPLDVQEHRQPRTEQLPGPQQKRTRCSRLRPALPAGLPGQLAPRALLVLPAIRAALVLPA